MNGERSGADVAPRGLSRVSAAARAAINGPQLALHNTLANIPLISICQLTVYLIIASCFSPAENTLSNRICLRDK